MDKYMKLVIQMPCYNEAETLNIALDALSRTLGGIDYTEYLVINGGNRDDTLQAAKQWGADYIVSFEQSEDLAKGFMAGIDGCLCQGADIIVGTDADNQYCMEDTHKLIEPILRGGADIIVGVRPVDKTTHFSPAKKKLQHFGSRAVKEVSNTQIPDTPSGFRTYSREAAIRTNVVNDYAYMLETTVQAGREEVLMTGVPIRTDGELRSPRLFNSIWRHVKKSIITIIRTYVMYKPLKCFTLLCIPPMLADAMVGICFLIFYFRGTGTGHVQSLILARALIIIGFPMLTTGLLDDILTSSKKSLENTQYRAGRIEYDILQNKREIKEYDEGTSDTEGDAHE